MRIFGALKHSNTRCIVVQLKNVFHHFGDMTRVLLGGFGCNIFI